MYGVVGDHDDRVFSRHVADVVRVAGVFYTLSSRCHHHVAAGVSVCDTLFVELAARTRCPLVTFDKAVAQSFPDVAIRPRDLTC